MRWPVSFTLVFFVSTLSADNGVSQTTLQKTQPIRIEATKNDHSADIYLARSLAERILAFNDTRAKTISAARLANVLEDEAFARGLFEKALSFTSVTAETDGQLKVRSALQRNVIAIIARRDSAWAERLIDALTAKEDSEKHSKSWGSTNLNTAISLLDSDSKLAVRFAERSLGGGVNQGYLDFLLALRKTDESRADQLFLQTLAYFSQQQSLDIKQFHAIGVYLFTAPGMSDSDYYAITRVGDILVPNIAIERPGIQSSLVRAYLQTAATVLWSIVGDADQRPYSYALAYLLVPKARATAPDLVNPIEGAMAAISGSVPLNVKDESAYKNINATPSSFEEKLRSAENKPDSESRDIAYLDLAFQAWLKADFKTARTAANRIGDDEASRTLSRLNDFGEAVWLVKKDGSNIRKAQSIANRLPQCIEKAISLLKIAQVTAKQGESVEAEQYIDLALKSARTVSDVRRPFLIILSAAQLSSLHSVTSPSVLREAIKDFNSFADASFTSVNWNTNVKVGALTERFPLDVNTLRFNFEDSFQVAMSTDIEAGLSIAADLKNEDLRGRAFVEVASSLLKSSPKSLSQERQAIRVGEDGMRKSASKVVMPSYPEEAIRKRQHGVTVVEVQYDGKGDITDAAIIEAPATVIGDAVISAVKSWKFVPSKTQDGKPASIRGKLTFYFVLDEDGKGHVENPKQFR